METLLISYSYLPTDLLPECLQEFNKGSSLVIRWPVTFFYILTGCTSHSGPFLTTYSYLFTGSPLCSDGV